MVFSLSTEREKSVLKTQHKSFYKESSLFRVLVVVLQFASFLVRIGKT